METKKRIRSFQDLEVYQSTYESMLIVHKEIIDKYDKASRQLYNLALAWDNFNKRNRKTDADSSYTTE